MDQLKKDVKKTAKINKRPFPTHLFDVDSKNQTAEMIPKSVEKADVSDLFKELPMFLRSMTIFYNWAVCTLTYYALTTMSTTLSKNIFLNYK